MIPVHATLANVYNVEYAGISLAVTYASVQLAGVGISNLAACMLCLFMHVKTWYVARMPMFDQTCVCGGKGMAL